MNHPPPSLSRRWLSWLPALLTWGTLGAGAVISLFPLWDRIAAHEATALVPPPSTASPTPPSMPPLCLSRWESVGGCGVSGAGKAGGGAKWVGRGVSGGLLDLQTIASHNAFFDGAQQTSVSTRFATTLNYKWVLAANVPFLNNIEEVDVFGGTETAHLPGWGDLSLELTRKLGITNAYTVTASFTIPTGSYDAVRQGVVLPQRMQLGSGAVSASLTLEHTKDYDWGLMIYGGTLSYGGERNRMGDQRASTASCYVHAGYILGPVVLSTGLNLTTKFGKDLERGEPIPDQPMSMASLNITAEWSSDWVAALLSSSSDLTGWTNAFGLQTSLF